VTAASTPVVASVHPETDGWVGQLEAHPRVIRSARSLSQLHERLKEAASTQLGRPVDDINLQLNMEALLPPDTYKALITARKARNDAERARAEATAATRKALEELVSVGLSHQDAGMLVGLTQQRVSQLLVRDVHEQLPPVVDGPKATVIRGTRERPQGRKTRTDKTTQDKRAERE